MLLLVIFATGNIWQIFQIEYLVKGIIRGPETWFLKFIFPTIEISETMKVQICAELSLTPYVLTWNNGTMKSVSI
jgi:hypothetical protein